MLIILGGLPGTGKTTIARELARQLGAVHVRIDSIEEAILDSGVLSSPINDAGYRVGYAVAADNLRIGRTVIADSVNPIPLSRDAWVEVAFHAQVSAVEIELTCSDTKEHQHRVETRISDIARSRSRPARAARNATGSARSTCARFCKKIPRSDRSATVANTMTPASKTQATAGRKPSVSPEAATISGDGVSPAASAAANGSPPGNAAATCRTEDGHTPPARLRYYNRCKAES
jgi:predicted kinase